ncbi:hemagglutinin repeat-containing protein [Agrobacterium radiobacter]|nr:hemagglutinin repeat-containing protein [Agrobacterium tumefaciens]
MAALVDYAKDKSSSFGLQLSLSSIGFDIGKSKGYDETLTNASITAAGNVSLTSGRDTALLGGNIVGRTVDLDVGRDLAILSPQAQGWRDGFSFGLTVGVNPADWSVRGSKEDGFKAWSSGSGIVAAQGIDIKVGEDTTLVGALLQATDGDISLDTGTLTVADLKDTDQYKNVGGSIGLSGGGLNSVGFSYEKKDKQGETRTTLDASGELNVNIRDADKDGIAGTEADKAAAEQLLASINKDASKYQEITKDSYAKLSGELDVQNLIEFGDNIKAIQNYQRAMNAAIPEAIAAEGPENVDYYRRLLANGLTPTEAARAIEAPEIQQFVSSQRVWNDAVGFYGSASKVPAEIKAAIANGIKLDFSTGEPLIRREGCETNGFGCEVKFQTQNAEGMRQAEIAVSNAKSELETLVPQLQALLDKALSGDLTINPAALSLEIEKTKAKISAAMFIYELCYDTVGETSLVKVLKDVVNSTPSNAGGIYGELGAADVTGFLETSFSDVRRKVFYSDNPGAIETADEVLLLTPSPTFLASDVKLTGKVIASGALRLYETTAGKWLSKEAVEYSVGKGSDWSLLGGALREAANSASAALQGKGKINFGMGSFNEKQTMAMGEAWVGPGYRITSNGYYESADRLRQFRPPSYKDKLGKIQANFEQRLPGQLKWGSNGHVDVVP